MLILVVPNFRAGNKIFATNLDKHNLSIMSPKALKQHVPSSIRVHTAQFFGGPFNIGLFSYKTRLIENIRFGLFLLQRLLLDPVLLVISKVGITFNNWYFSPSIILIGTKRKSKTRGKTESHNSERVG